MLNPIPESPAHSRRTDSERHQVGDYFDSTKRYYDQNFELTVVKLFSGECYITNQPGEMIVTILGSCVAACVRDPIAKVGGMNHFLLPGNDSNSSTASDAARYGVHAMEQLINGILRMGGRKDRMEVKVFGGANVIDNSAMIGVQNAKFVRTFVKKEGLKILSEDLEGECPRRVHYFPDTGKVMLRTLRRREDAHILKKERQYEKRLLRAPQEGEIELF